MIIPKTNVSALLNGPPSRGPVDTCWVRFVRVVNNYSMNGGNSPRH